jgi:hypothetical protein
LPRHGLLSELQRGSRLCERRRGENLGDARAAAGTAEAISPLSLAVLDFARCVASAAIPRDPAHVLRYDILLRKMLSCSPSIDLNGA